MPVVLAIFSKRLVVVFGCFLLAVIAICAFVEPSNVAVTLATGVNLGGMIIALTGIVARRNARVLQAEIATLRRDVNRLLVSEDRRLVRELKSSANEDSASISMLAASGDRSALTGRPESK